MATRKKTGKKKTLKKTAKKKPAKKKPAKKKTTRKKPAPKPRATRMYVSDFDRALRLGRPPNVAALFPNSRALLVSGKVIDRAMLARGNSIAMAANGRNSFVIRGVLRAAQRANSALIIEIARSEGGANPYCAVNYWNIARQVDAAMNEMKITVPVAIHADHYGLKKPEDLAPARVEIPTLFESGLTSIAIDASHMPEDQNLLANLDLNQYIPDWAGLETEVGEIKGQEGLSTAEEALFLIRGLNAHEIFPDWIALNNGSSHGIQASDLGIQVDLTAEIHEALTPYEVSGAQHGTSGNNSDRLRAIAKRTRTTKANVATALQMVSWGVEVDDYGNAQMDEQGRLIKIPGQGMNEEMWAEMMSYADSHGLAGGNTKKLNLPFENKLLGQPSRFRDRMVERVEDFAYNMMVNVFAARDTAGLAVDVILETGSYDPGTKARRIENPAEWTRERITRPAAGIQSNKGPAGNFDD